jgi:hypothetical protein
MGRLDGGNLLGFLGILKDYLVWLHLTGANLNTQGNVDSLGFGKVFFLLNDKNAHIPLPIRFY